MNTTNPMRGNLRVGFSGTQHGMTPQQRLQVGWMVGDSRLRAAHHGMCIGADYDFHSLCRASGLWIVGHPPINQSKMADLTNCDELRTPKEYLDRNHDIVDESDYLIFTPKENEEVLRSGTWSTIRYAYKQLKLGYIVLPRGEVTYYEPNKEW